MMNLSKEVICMAMGNYCYIQNIECPYATVLGTCQDDIYEDYGICKMLGNPMPNKEWSPEIRKMWIKRYYSMYNSERSHKYYELCKEIKGKYR